MQRMFGRRSAMLALLLSGLLGCRDSTAPAACAGRLDLLVSSGVTPTISWSPSCGLSGLAVFKEPVPFSAEQFETPAWAFTVSELTPIGPGVRYGRAPSGANVSKAPETLLPGAAYRVAVYYTVGGDSLVAIGERMFVP